MIPLRKGGELYSFTQTRLIDIQAAIKQMRKVEIAIVNKRTLRDVEYFNSLHDIRRQAIARHEVINISKTNEKGPMSK